MKNLLYTAMLIALPLLSIAQTERKISADIRGRNCAGGLGLCSVSKLVEFNQESKILAFKLEESTVELQFNKTLLSEEEQKSLLNTTLMKITASQTIEFVQEEDLIIDNETLLFLEIAPKYNTIRKGNYPVEINDHTIKVRLKLWEQ